MIPANLVTCKLEIKYALFDLGMHIFFKKSFFTLELRAFLKIHINVVFIVIKLQAILLNKIIEY